MPAITHAVLLGDVRGRVAAEALVAQWVGKLAPGYPMVLASTELPLDLEEHLGSEADPPAPAHPQRAHAGWSLRVVAGFFPSERAARRFGAEALGGAGTVHAVPGPPPVENSEAFWRSRGIAVAIAHPAPAYADVDIARLASVAGSVGRGEDEDARWERALAQLAPACSVRAGQVFETDESVLYQQARRFAPVECEGGRRAWVTWVATRLESVVRVEKEGPFVYQLVDLKCEIPSIDRTPFLWASPLRPRRTAPAHCAGGS